MTTLDFPVAPLIGDRFPTPSVAGMPQYIWDGEKWTTATNTITTAPPSTATPLEDNATPQIGVTTKYAREDHVHPSTALKYSAQSLSEAQKVQSRTNLYAAPFDALAYSGMQINGSMEVSQELGTAGTSTDGRYVCDGWIFYNKAVGSSIGTAAIINPVIIPPFPSYLHMGVVTAKTTLATNEFVSFAQFIEGYRISRLGWGTAKALPLTIGFWSSHVRTGIYSVGICNSALDRSCVAAYTQAVSSAPQYNIVTFPACTDGIWKSDNTIGIILHFYFAANAAFTAPATSTWYPTLYRVAAGQVNAIAATSDVNRITGIVIIPGIEAPSAERSPLIMRPYDQELLTCQRYWESGVGLFTYRAGTGFQTGITSAYDTIPFLTRKRADPTMTFNAGWAYYTTADAQPAFTPTMSFVDTRCFGFMGSGFTNWKAWSRINNPIWYADARL